MVDVALVDSVFASLENIPQKYFVDGDVPTRNGNRYEFIYPYDSFKAGDGWVIIGIANDAIWSRFVEASGIEGLRHDERFSSNPQRVDNHGALKSIIERWTSERKVDDIVTFLTEHRIPACPIYDVRAASEDPHIAGARGMIVEMEHPGIGEARLLGNPIKMSETRPVPRGPAPSLGGDTVDILEDLLGIPKKNIGRLRDEGIV